MKRHSWMWMVGAAAVAGGVWLLLRHRTETPLSKAEAVASIDARLTTMVSRGMAGSILLEDRGEVLLDKGYGLADRSTGRVVTPDTGFDIGSLVKPFTAIAILRLETRGRLRRSDPLRRFFPAPPQDKAGITIQQLLSHSAGLPDIVNGAGQPVDYKPDFDYEPVSRDEIVRRAMLAKLVFQPGAKSQYSNLGYSLLGVIIEIASGEPYEQFVRETVLLPAGMLRTGYGGPGWKRNELAVGYRRDKPWGTPLDHPWVADGPSWNLRANGGMLSTSRDLAGWIHAIAGGRLLTPAEQTVFFELYVHCNARGARTMGGAGSNEVFDSCFLWYLDEHRLLVMLTSSDDERAEELIPELARQMRRIRT